MNFSRACLNAVLLGAGLLSFRESMSTCRAAGTGTVAKTSDSSVHHPYIEGKTLINGIIGDGGNYPTEEVFACCKRFADPISSCNDPGANTATCMASSEQKDQLKMVSIGKMPQFSAEDSLRVLESAKAAWNGGTGVWPQLSLSERINAVERFVALIRPHREKIVEVLMWEIGKSRKDAEAEFDRTLVFVEKAIASLRSPGNSEFGSDFESLGKVHAFRRRAAIGILVCLGPYNYPLNETYATLIPALLMGNVVIMKIPTIGGLAHLLTMEAFAKALPPGAINLISGGGRITMPPLMRSGAVDGLAFIGGSSAADNLIKEHPEPHRLKLFLQLEAKNMGIFLPDLFQPGYEAMLERAVNEAVLGSLSFNGQRCTALKLLFVPTEHAAEFANMMARRIEQLKVGLPNEDDVEITPLPNRKRTTYMTDLIEDATAKGASVLNDQGGTFVGGDTTSTLMRPALLFPVEPSMRIYHEEQFGPVVPVAPYDSLDTVMDYGRLSKYAQQVSIFTSGDSSLQDTVTIIDQFSSVYGKINLNSQCGRSPDSLPFSARRSSGMGVMSIEDALREFSVPTVVSYKDEATGAMVDNLMERSKFMSSLQ